MLTKQEAEDRLRVERMAQHGDPLARVVCRVVAMMDVMTGYIAERVGVAPDVDVDDWQGTPTPLEPTPPSAGKDTPMERSTDNNKERATPTAQEKFSELRGLGPVDPSHVNWDAVGGEIERLKNTPHVQKKNSDFRDTHPNWLCGGSLDEVAEIFSSGSPEKNSENVGPVSALAPECLGDLRVYGADPDNGPDGAFGPDVVEVERKSATQIRMASVMEDYVSALRRRMDDDERVSAGTAYAELTMLLRSSGLL